MQAWLGVRLGSGLLAFASFSFAQSAVESTRAAEGTAAPEAVAAPHTVNPARHADGRADLTARRWYGWQILTVDSAVPVLALTGLVLVSSGEPESSAGFDRAAEVLGVAGVVGYFGGGPTIHLLHRRPWQALASLGLRAGLPVLGGAVGLESVACSPSSGGYGSCGAPELIIGVAAGTLLAIALDAGLLAWEPRPARLESSRVELGFTPVLTRDGGRELRVFGRF